MMDFRVSPDEASRHWQNAISGSRCAAAEAQMQAVHPDARIELTENFAIPGLVPEQDGEAETLVRALTGDNASHVVSYGTEAGQFQEAGYSAVICGPGDIAQAHQPNEFISIAQFEAGHKFMQRWWLKLVGEPDVTPIISSLTGGLKMPVKNRLAEMHDEITKWRRHLHAHPELMYDVHETAGFVVDRLKEFGVDEITPGIGKTGVVAVIKGRQDTQGRVIGLRADMDALPIEEATGLDYASTVSGKMHACGHDGHTSMLLGAAQYLAETRNFDGTVVLIFQPAEEGGAGGLAMCQDGLMERWGIQEVYGMHNMPGLACRRICHPPRRAAGFVRRVRDHRHRQRRPRRRPA